MKPIDKEVRHAAMRVVFDLLHLHPEARKTTTALPDCRICEDLRGLMNLLDAEQREYGPPIDVTDPSWLREHRTGATA